MRNKTSYVFYSSCLSGLRRVKSIEVWGKFKSEMKVLRIRNSINEDRFGNKVNEFRDNYVNLIYEIKIIIK